MDGQNAAGGAGGAGDAAAEALRAAQQAVANLKMETGSGAPVSEPVEAASNDALAAAQAAIAAAKLITDHSPPAAGGPSRPAATTHATTPMGQPMQMPEFPAPTAQKAPEGIDLLSDVNLNVKIELGRTKMLVEDVLRLGSGSVVELDKLAGDPVDVYVNDRHVAKGEVLVLNDNFCVRINEIVSSVGDAGRARASGAGAA